MYRSPSPTFRRQNDVRERGGGKGADRQTNSHTFANQKRSVGTADGHANVYPKFTFCATNSSSVKGVRRRISVNHETPIKSALIQNTFKSCSVTHRL